MQYCCLKNCMETNMNKTTVGTRLLTAQRQRLVLASARRNDRHQQINIANETDRATPTRGAAILSELYNVQASWLLFGREKAPDSSDGCDLIGQFTVFRRRASCAAHDVISSRSKTRRAQWNNEIVDTSDAEFLIQQYVEVALTGGPVEQIGQRQSSLCACSFSTKRRKSAARSKYIEDYQYAVLARWDRVEKFSKIMRANTSNASLLYHPLCTVVVCAVGDGYACAVVAGKHIKQIVEHTKKNNSFFDGSPHADPLPAAKDNTVTPFKNAKGVNRVMIETTKICSTLTWNLQRHLTTSTDQWSGKTHYLVGCDPDKLVALELRSSESLNTTKTACGGIEKVAGWRAYVLVANLSTQVVVNTDPLTTYAVVVETPHRNGPPMGRKAEPSVLRRSG